MPSVRYEVHTGHAVVHLLDGEGFVTGFKIPDPNLAKDISTVANAIIAVGNPGLAAMVSDFFDDLQDLMEGST
jgi:hypothetical protein